MTINYQPRAGRPKMPWCPDCRKQVPPKYEKKEPGQGYCKHHQRVRVRTAYTLRKQAADPTYIHPEQRASVLDQDLRAHIQRVGADNVDLEFIKMMYVENALAPLPDDELRAMYLPASRVSDKPDFADLDFSNLDLSSLKDPEVNPYD
jgi:hypothetical protein